MPKLALEKKKYTYEDYLQTPEDTRYEIIEGELLMTPSPVTKHQRVSMKLVSAIFNFVSDNDLGEVFAAPYDVVLDEHNVLQPDILFISKERLDIIGEKNIQGAPDLVIEIISENTAYRDTIQKKRLYARFGVKEYWLVAPEDRIVEVYTLEEGGYQLTKTYLEGDILGSQNINGLKIELKKIFKTFYKNQDV